MKWVVHKGVFHRLSKNTNSEVNLRCNMCEFCEDKPKEIISYMGLKPSVIEMISTRIEDGNTLKVLGTLQSSYFAGAIPLEAEAKISYCPICGRKLVKE